jgi:Flp pilus assembly protein TadG
VRRFLRSEEGQGIVEFALVLPPVLLLLVFGLVEIATVLSDGLYMTSATREGARVGSALVNGGGALGCNAGQSPNAATVDPNIVAAVERVLTGAGTKIALSDVTEIWLWKATASGGETTGLINVWQYQLNGGPVIDGQALDFRQVSQPWLPCTRFNGTPADSIGVTVVYTYRGRTPLRMLIPMFDTFTMTDHTVMSMNANR